MDAQQLSQFEKLLIDELFANLTQPPQPEPLQIAAPKATQPRPYYRGPSPEKIQRRQIENQLRALVGASTARLYDRLMERLDEMKAQYDRIEAQQKQNAEQREELMLEIKRAAQVSPPCTPSRNNLY